MGFSCSPEEWGLALPRQRKNYLLVTLKISPNHHFPSEFLCSQLSAFSIFFLIKCFFLLLLFSIPNILDFHRNYSPALHKAVAWELWPLEISSGRLSCSSDLAPRAKPPCALRELHPLSCINGIWSHHLSNWRCWCGRIRADRKLNCVDHEHLRVD